MSLFWSIIAVCITLWGSDSIAFATAVFYPDRSSVSPNGRLRIDAKSPDNAVEGSNIPFAANFTYTVTDLTTGKVLWTRKQPMTRLKGEPKAWPDEGSPMEVFVQDDGSAAAFLSTHSMVFMDRNGHRTGEGKVLESFPEHHRAEFVSNSTAGPMWTQYSRFGFATVPASASAPLRTVFAVRTYWLLLLVFDATDGSLINLGAHAQATSTNALLTAPPETRRILSAVLDAERAWVAQTLQRSAASASRTNADDGTAIFLAGQLNLRDNEPALRVIEDRAYKSAMGSPWWHARSDIRTSLRRMGLVPDRGFGAFIGKMKKRESPVALITSDERAAAAGWINVGLSVEELIDAIGHPDFNSSGSNSYDYDIDAIMPYTLRVTLTVDRVSQVERVQPAFLELGLRER